MGLLDSFTSPGGLTGLSSAPQKGLQMRASQFDKRLEELDDPIEKADEKLNNGELNEKLKQKTLKTLMRKLKTANKGLVLSELESYKDWDDITSVIEIKPTDIDAMIANIKFSVADLNESEKRYDTTFRYDPSMMALKDPDKGGATTPYVGKITGAGPTQEEVIAFKADDTGRSFEDLRDTLAFEGVDSGIPGTGYKNVGVADFYGRSPNDPNYDEETGFMRVAAGPNDFAFSTVRATTGERIYDLTRQYGFDNNASSRRLANELIEDRTLGYFGLFPNRNLQGQLIAPTTKAGKTTRETTNYVFAQPIMDRVKRMVSSVIGQSGEIPTSMVESFVDNEYDKFFDLMEAHAVGYNLARSKGGSKAAQYIAGEEAAGNVKKQKLNSDQENTLRLYATPYIRATTTKDTGSGLFNTQRALTSRSYFPENKATRVPVTNMINRDGTVTVIFNDMSIIKAEPNDPIIAPYL
jgi:hypothetical protein